MNKRIRKKLRKRWGFRTYTNYHKKMKEISSYFRKQMFAYVYPKDSIRWTVAIPPKNSHRIVTDRTVQYDQMILYAANRKGGENDKNNRV